MSCALALSRPYPEIFSLVSDLSQDWSRFTLTLGLLCLPWPLCSSTPSISPPTSLPIFSTKLVGTFGSTSLA